MISWWLGNPIVVITVFVVSIFFGFALFDPKNGSSTARNTSIAIWAIGALGLYSIAMNSYRLKSEIEASAYGSWIIGASTPISIYVSSNNWCLPGIRGENSPINFDDIEAARSKACIWQKSAQAAFLRLNVKEFPELPKEITDGFPDFDWVVLNQDREEISSAINLYDEMRNEALRLQSEAKKSSTQIAFDLLSPLLLAVAMGLQGGKVIRERIAI